MLLADTLLRSFAAVNEKQAPVHGQSMRNKRPCTDSAWALGFLSEKGRAEAEPNIVSVKFIGDYSPFSSFSLRAARASMSPRVVFSTALLMLFTALLVEAASLAAAFSLTS